MGCVFYSVICLPADLKLLTPEALEVVQRRCIWEKMRHTRHLNRHGKSLEQKPHENKVQLGPDASL